MNRKSRLEIRFKAIAKRLPKKEKFAMAEIGVLNGELSAKILSKFNNIKKYIQVDRWCIYSAEEQAVENNSPMSYRNQKYFDSMKEENLKNIKRYKKRAKIIEMDSVDAAEYIKDEALHLCFIDAAHSYVGVMRDIKAWYPKVKKGGWICGHDIDRVTVKQAVTEFFKDDKIIYDEERTWFVQKK
jgi:hypothetical protein